MDSEWQIPSMGISDKMKVSYYQMDYTKDGRYIAHNFWKDNHFFNSVFYSCVYDMNDPENQYYRSILVKTLCKYRNRLEEVMRLEKFNFDYRGPGRYSENDVYQLMSVDEIDKMVSTEMTSLHLMNPPVFYLLHLHFVTFVICHGNFAKIGMHSILEFGFSLSSILYIFVIYISVLIS
jgi:hypothetical protein